MKKSRFTEAQFVSILKQADAGVPVKDVCWQAGISVASYYQWRYLATPNASRRTSTGSVRGIAGATATGRHATAAGS
jgi:hypothetical protein